jgi:hypothetical protein
MKPACLKITEPRNSTDHRSGLNMSVARGNSYQVWWAPDAFGLIWTKEDMLALLRKKTDPRIRQNRGFQTGNFPKIPERC